MSISAHAFATRGVEGMGVSGSSAAFLSEIVALGFAVVASGSLGVPFFEIFFLTKRTGICFSGLCFSEESDKILERDAGVSISAQPLPVIGDEGMGVSVPNPGASNESDKIFTGDAGVSTSAHAVAKGGDGGMGVSV